MTRLSVILGLLLAVIIGLIVAYLAAGDEDQPVRVTFTDVADDVQPAESIAAIAARWIQ